LKTNKDEHWLQENIVIMANAMGREVESKGGIDGYGWEDIAQEILLAVYEARHGYDPKRGSSLKYARSVANNRVKELWRHQWRIKRRPDAMLKEEEGYCSMVVDLDMREMDKRLSQVSDFGSAFAAGLRDMVRLELRRDLEKAMAGASEREWKVVRLCLCFSPAEVAKIMGVPRTTLNYWLRKIRGRLIKKGLGVYLK